MQIRNCFSTPFWQSQLTFDTAAVVAKCLQMRANGFSNRTVSNRGGWQSTNINLSMFDEFKELNEQVLQSLQHIASTIDDKLTLRMLPAWININEKNNFNTQHNHSGYLCTFSSVVYIQVDENSGKIYFEDNFSPMVYFPHMLPPTRKILPTKAYFVPKTGMMLTFPAWVPHGVEPSKSDLTRISIAFNISVGER